MNPRDFFLFINQTVDVCFIIFCFFLASNSPLYHITCFIRHTSNNTFATYTHTQGEKRKGTKTNLKKLSSTAATSILSSLQFINSMATRTVLLCFISHPSCIIIKAATPLQADGFLLQRPAGSARNKTSSCSWLHDNKVRNKNNGEWRVRERRNKKKIEKC